MDEARSDRFRGGTAASLLGLVGGVVVGGLLQGSEHVVVGWCDELLKVVGGLWLNALRMIVLPLVITQLVVAIAGRGSRGLGRLGAGALGIFVALLATAAVFAVLAAPPLIERVAADPGMMDSLGTVIPEAAREAAERRPADMSFGEWLVGLVPTNPLQALVDGNLLQIIVFTVPFAISVTFLAPRPRRRLVKIFEALAESMMIFVRWILMLTPAAVFALAYGFSRQAGGELLEALIAFVVILSALLLAFTLLLYPIAILGGGVSPRAFARAVFPGQVVAVTTRSSLASLPALMVGARERLAMPEAIVGFALPLSASTLKVNRPLSGTVNLLFLAHVYDIPLGAEDIAMFILVTSILSASTVGLPSGGTMFVTLPVYLALGVPIEGVVLLKAVDVIPDVFKTLANTTGYMTVAAILMRVRGGRARSPAEP